VASASGWYDAHAPEIVGRFEAIDAASLHSWLSGLLPDAPGTMLDIGAGSGRDAGWFVTGRFGPPYGPEFGRVDYVVNDVVMDVVNEASHATGDTDGP
jgi:hypothetical protein